MQQVAKVWKNTVLGTELAFVDEASGTVVKLEKQLDVTDHAQTAHEKHPEHGQHNL